MSDEKTSMVSHHGHDFNLGHHSIHEDQLYHLQNAIKAMSSEQVRQLKEHSHTEQGGHFSYHLGGVDHHFKVVSNHDGKLEVQKIHHY